MPTFGKWEGIETAPKERKIIVSWVNAYGKRRTTFASFWPAGSIGLNEETGDEFVDENGMNIEEGWFECREAGDAVDWMLNEPLTHWMPLPSPPVQPNGSVDAEGERHP